MKQIFVLSMICCIAYGALFLLGCTPAIDPKRTPFAEGLAYTKKGEELALGRKYYVLNCGGCHNHIYPSERTPPQWKITLQNHVGRVYLSKAEYEKLEKYILLVSEIDHKDK